MNKKTRRASSTFKAIKDQYATYEEVQKALRKAGLEGCDLILGLDATKSNTWNGRLTFKPYSENLHALIGDNVWNPYQQVIHIVGRTLEPFDDDNQIPTYIFGDASTKAVKVRSITETGAPCDGFRDVLSNYNRFATEVRMSGPTSFAPMIKKAIEIVKENKSYHILVIIADGAVTCVDETREAIIKASKYPLSIIVVGVGDGNLGDGEMGAAWKIMEEFDDGLPARTFDNFQFVNFHQLMMERSDNPELDFVVAALQEVPQQFKTIQKLGLTEKMIKREKRRRRRKAGKKRK
jgi:hypothetical protein